MKSLFDLNVCGLNVCVFTILTGDDNFRIYFDSILGNAYRLVNGVDGVPFLPPFPRYTNTAREWWLRNQTGPEEVIAGVRGQIFWL